jgi:hypothetical protein
MRQKTHQFIIDAYGSKHFHPQLKKLNPKPFFRQRGTMHVLFIPFAYMTFNTLCTSFICEHKTASYPPLAGAGYTKREIIKWGWKKLNRDKKDERSVATEAQSGNKCRLPPE